MTEQTLLRLAMVLQNQAPTTLNKYICNLAEAILMDFTDGINLFDLNNLLNSQFNLAFTEEEVRDAVTQKAQGRILVNNGIYKLSPTVLKKLEVQTTLSDELSDIIRDFVSEFNLDRAVENIHALLLSYFYFCFNSNVDNLLSLFENRISVGGNAFEASAENVSLINEFISWRNPRKDALVYKLVATCYEYCMLTIKKDNILSTELFKGKRFYLDANIIFRMAGINNEERRTVTQGFIDHCRRAGIELYCTSTTLDEVYRVIASQVEYIRGIAGQSMPVSCDRLEGLNPHTEVNDFYRIYYDWCREPGNKCGDFQSFNKYLLKTVQDTVSQLKIKESTPFKVNSYASQFNQQVVSLKVYKNTKRTWRHTSTLSAETDIINIMDTLMWRTGTGTNIWQTNDFIVSADQLLIGWSNEAYSGVPIVVLPSVWLSIILRFTGRSDDDYKSFCLFLTQRHHFSTEEIIDPIQLLRTINQKTNKTEIKEQIIAEIIQNKTQYAFKNPNDYNESADRAFDKVLEEVYGNTKQQIAEVREEMRKQLTAMENETAEKIAEEANIHATAEREKTIVTLSKKKAAGVVQPFRSLADFGWIAYLVAGITVAVGLAVWTWEISPIYEWIINALPGKVKGSFSQFLEVWGLVTCIIGLLVFGIKGWVAYMGSENREKKLYERFYRENTEALK